MKKTTKKKTSSSRKKKAAKTKAKRKPAAKKKTAKKKTAGKKPTAKKGAPKKTTKKKASGATASKKKSSKKPAVKKKASKKTAKKSSGTTKLKVAEVAVKEPKPRKKRRPKRRMSDKQKVRYREMLLALRQKLSSQISVLKQDSLKRTDSVVSEEDGTDAFDRQFALNLASSENKSLFEVDEAIRRLDQGLYGVCDDCFALIGEARLEALPFVRLCVQCQSEREKGKLRYAASGIRHGY